MVAVENLSFSYKVGHNRFAVLKDISFRVQKGGILCIIGPSGCGKTTLLFSIAGLRRPEGGRVLINGEPVLRTRERTAMIFQHFGLLPWETIFENVALGLKIRGVERGKIRRYVEGSLDRFGILHLAGKYPKHLSGGEKQRVAIARALVLRPDLLLLDEPFSAIDALTRETLQEFLIKVWKDWDLTMIHVTHDIEEAVFLGTEIVVLGKDGSVRTTCSLSSSDKGSSFRDSPAFRDAASTLRGHMKGIIDEAAR